MFGEKKCGGNQETKMFYLDIRRAQKKVTEGYFIDTNIFPTNIYDSLTTDIKKLQVQYNSLKKQKITDKAKSGSGSAPDKKSSGMQYS